MTEVLGIVTISLAMIAGAWLILSRETSLFGIPMSSSPLSRGAMLTFYAMLAGMADPLRENVGYLQQPPGRCGRPPTASLPGWSDNRTSAILKSPWRPIATTATWCSRTSASATRRAIRCWRGSICGSASARPSPSSAPTAAARARWPISSPALPDPTTGVLRLDGVPLSDLRLRDLRGQIGLVTQETMLFDDTIFNNIRYGAPDATRVNK